MLSSHHLGKRGIFIISTGPAGGALHPCRVGKREKSTDFGKSKQSTAFSKRDTSTAFDCELLVLLKETKGQLFEMNF